MPDGPLLLSPDIMAKSFYREVIKRRPDLFKIQFLEYILALFPDNSEPFYSGFGNRASDAISYKAVLIPKGKTYIINPRGELSSEIQTMYKKSYSCINEIVDMTFPFIKTKVLPKATLTQEETTFKDVKCIEIELDDHEIGGSSYQSENFNNFNYNKSVTDKILGQDEL